MGLRIPADPLSESPFTRKGSEQNQGPVNDGS